MSVLSGETILGFGNAIRTSTICVRDPGLPKMVGTPSAARVTTDRYMVLVLANRLLRDEAPESPRGAGTSEGAAATEAVMRLEK